MSEVDYSPDAGQIRPKCGGVDGRRRGARRCKELVHILEGAASERRSFAPTSVADTVLIQGLAACQTHLEYLQARVAADDPAVDTEKLIRLTHLCARLLDKLGLTEPSAHAKVPPVRISLSETPDRISLSGYINEGRA